MAKASSSPGRVSNRYKSNVLNILPVTIFRTIDLAGKKNPDSLFSRFCAEESVFFEGFSAPKCVQENQDHLESSGTNPTASKLQKRCRLDLNQRNRRTGSRS
jgi:hypothetical protein